ncbi:hypothetical protein CMI37_36765 [Candidatus Pacearchaeota archaeon]|nr:hypothetical protein [Candidatus Pacearchaeota archaeon]
MYTIEDRWGEPHGAVIAKTAQDAKKIIYGDDRVDGLEWIDFSARWLKGADISGFQEGIFEDCWEAIKRGIFNSQGEGCEFCETVNECSAFLEKPK